MPLNALQAGIHRLWQDEILAELSRYITIPNKSPAFDAHWQTNGYMDQAVELMSQWARQKLSAIAGAKLEVVRLAQRTPVIFIEIPGADNDDSVLLYGHLDKQPEMTGWSDGLSPWQPVLKEGKLYGRGGADDGYALYACIAAITALHQQGLPHSRCVILIEACEESGSYDLPFYVDYLAERIGQPSLVVCLDSGCADYDRLWLTTSLRGLLNLNVSVDVLTQGVHSGDASGVVADSFRVLRQLLSRLEDEQTGFIHLEALQVSIPPQRIEQAKQCAAIVGSALFTKFPLSEGMQAVSADLVELILNRTWRAQLSITGIAGLPALADAGNVLRPNTTARLSLRLPPTLAAQEAAKRLKHLLENQPPYGAKVQLEFEQQSNGWNAPALEPWLAEALQDASQRFFGQPAAYLGEGGSIPFMAMLGEKFPHAQFVITGVLGPHSNAHGPDEFLSIETAERVSCVVADVLTKQYLHACA